MKIKGLGLEILELIAVSTDFPCSLINRFECSSRNIYRIIERLIDAGLMIGDNMELLKRMLLSDGGTRKQLFKVDDTFNEFYYVPEDKNGDFMISILVNKEIRNQIDKELIEMFEITECLLPYVCTGMDGKGQPVLFAYDLNMVNLRKFKSGLEMFEERGIVICFGFQKKVLEEYFEDLADIVVILMMKK